jgi:transcription termination factor NusB
MTAYQEFIKLLYDAHYYSNELDRMAIGNNDIDDPVIRSTVYKCTQKFQDEAFENLIDFVVENHKKIKENIKDNIR